MTVDMTIILQVLSGIADVAVPLLAAWVAKEAITYFHISNNSATAERINSGVNALSDMALSELHTAAASGIKVSVNATVANAMNSVSESMANACHLQGTSPEDLAKRVAGSLITKAAASPPVVIAPAINNQGVQQ